MDRHVLALIPLPAETRDALSCAYVLHYCPEGPTEAVIGEAARHGVTAVVTNGTTGLPGACMARLTALQLVCSFGVGHENIDLVAAGARGIAVANAPDTNGETVADHALGFMLALSRGYAPLTKAVGDGRWPLSRAVRPTLNGSTVGIIGMGRVGHAIARRAAAFDMQVLYFDRGAKPHAHGVHVPALTELARQSDFLVAACPGGASTRHIVDKPVLDALGPEGYVVNVARGSVVCTDDLVAALQARTIAGAGLDVLETEPQVPAQLIGLDNVLITPHIAGRSPTAQLAQRDALMANLDAWFTGRPLLSQLAAGAPRHAAQA
ncbi:2-hydroxyacid dehydrogenase [Variovorax sp. E3]|uniref:2-hydroxyacid dehydrogenase n=1 Tax=Variovorax sp. E3 TaxID=1914993 RepID=UPI0018DB6846|nr:2-hydroxyacid dehydrogenase [Variovorax sp. E3]